MISQKINATPTQSTQFQMLNASQCDDIFYAALRILECTGCHVFSEKALQIFREAGAHCSGDQIKIPSFLVEKAISTAPKQITLYTTEGEPYLNLCAKLNTSHWGTGMESRFLVDRKTNQRRLATYQDAYETGLVSQAMENIDLISGMCYISDCAPLQAELYSCIALLETTTKPQMFFQLNQSIMETQLQIFSSLCGGMEAFLRKPFALSGVARTTPLVFEKEATEHAMRHWETGMPSIYGTTSIIGVTAPATMAGSLALSLADNLAGLVLAQTIHPGCPFVACNGLSPFDIKEMSPSLCGPDISIASTCSAEMFRYLNLPYVTLLGGTDSPIFDQQAAHDMEQQIMTGTIGGCCCSIFSGFLEMGLSCSIESLVYINEAIEVAGRFAKGIEVSTETLAEDIIRELSPVGNFLSTNHTMKHYMEAWSPKVFSRQSYENWYRQGSRDLRQRCIEVVDEIIENGPKKRRDPKLIEEWHKIINI